MPTTKTVDQLPTQSISNREYYIPISVGNALKKMTVGNLLSINNIRRIESTYAESINLDSGFYALTNPPALLIHILWNSDGYALQIKHDYATNKLKFRHATGSWSDWIDLN